MKLNIVCLTSFDLWRNLVNSCSIDLGTFHRRVFGPREVLQLRLSQYKLHGR